MGAEKKDEQVKFYVPAALMERCEAIFNRQGIRLSEGMTRLVQLLVNAPDEAKPLLLSQAPGNAAVVLATALLRAQENTVVVPLPRAVYDRIAARAAEDGYTDVARYIIRVMTPKEWVFKGGPDADDAGASSPRLPSEPGETSEAPTGATKRGRPPAQAR